MSDPDEAVRLMSTHCFASLIQLMPLDGISSDTCDISDVINFIDLNINSLLIISLLLGSKNSQIER